MNAVRTALATCARVSAIVLCCAFFLSQSGCYLAANGKVLEQRVQKVEDQQAEFTSTIQRTRDNLTKLVSQADHQVSSLREALKEARHLLGNSSASLGVQIDGLREKIKALQGQVDAAAYGNQQLQKKLDALKTDMDFRFKNSGR